jgi:hypothetical protein
MSVPVRKVLAVVKYPGSRAAPRWVPVDAIASAGMLEDDPDPTLSADLKLNNHTIIGQLEDETLIIDGGLL